MKSIIFIATVIIGVAIANKCNDPLVADLLTDAKMNEILQCASPKEKCNVPEVYVCMKYDLFPDICMRDRCPAPRSAFQCVMDKVGKAKAIAIANKKIVPGFNMNELLPAFTWATNSTDWRPDARCGAKYPLPDGRPGQCDPNGKWPCCSPGGWCGDSDDHCKCKGCTDFRLQAWRPDVRCGAKYPLDDGRPGQCDPTGEWPCCSPGDWCGNTKWHCKCDTCTNTDFRQRALGEESAFRLRNAAVKFAIDCNDGKAEFEEKYRDDIECLHLGMCPGFNDWMG